MKIIALEEHFQIATIKKAVAAFLPGGQDTSQLASYTSPDAQLEDLGAGRLKAMDAMGIDVQVLSYPHREYPWSQHQRLPPWRERPMINLRRPLPLILIALSAWRPYRRLIRRPLPPNSSVV